MKLSKMATRSSFFFIVGLFFFTSCQKNEISSSTSEKEDVTSPEIKVENGYLVFKDWKDFRLQLSKLLKSEEYATNWDKQIGFVSANDILNNAVNKLQSCNSKGEVLSVLNNYKDIISFDDDSTLQLSNIADIYSYIVNSAGIVKIGRDYYKFTKEKEIIMLNGTNSIHPSFGSTPVTNLKKGIIAFNYLSESNNSFSRVPLNYGLIIDTMTSTSGRRSYYQQDYEAVLEPVYSPYAELLGFNVGSSTYLHLWSTKHNIWGWSKYKSTFHIDILSFSVHCFQTGQYNIQDYPSFVTPEAKDYYNTFLAATTYVTKDDFYADNYTMPVLDITMHLRASSRGVAYDTVDVSYY